MSYPLAADYDLLLPSDLAPQPIAFSVVDRMGRNLNWLYMHHTPALVAFVAPSLLGGVSQSWPLAATPSADSLRYTLGVAITASAGANITIGVDTSTAGTSGPWTAAFSATATASGSAEWMTASGTIPGGVRYLRITVTAGSGSSLVDDVLLYPSPSALPDVGTSLPSGVVLYDDTALMAPGAAVHTEYADRIWQGVARILADRRQVVHSLVTRSDRTWSARGHESTVRLLHGTAVMAGQSSATLTVRYRLADTGTPGDVTLGQAGGATVSLVADDTDRTATLAVTGPEVELYCDATPGGTLTVPYLVADWAPGE